MSKTLFIAAILGLVLISQTDFGSETTPVAHAATPNQSVSRTRLYDTFTLKNRTSDGKNQQHLIAVRGTDVSLIENCSPSGVRIARDGLDQLQPIDIPNSVSISAFDAESQQFVRIQGKTKLQRGRGYFVKSNDPVICLTFAGDEARESAGNYLSLYPGWNLVAAPTSKVTGAGIAAGRAISLYPIGEHAERTGSIPGTDPSIASYLTSPANLYNPKQGYSRSLPFFTAQFFPSGWPIGEGVFVYAKKRVDVQFDQSGVELTSRGL